MREQNSQFKKDVLKAKAKYRKRRKFIILVIMTLALSVTLLQTFLYMRDKKQINSQLAEQNKTIENLDKENKVNELFPFRYPIKLDTLYFGGIDSSKCI